MKTEAAVLFSSPGRWELKEVELDEPKYGEVLVEMAASGLCHSDDHYTTGDLPPAHLPICGGHEGSGVVRALGPGITTLEVGDHFATSFIPSCGMCRWCASGMQQLCDHGAIHASGTLLDGTYRMHLDGQDVCASAGIGTFSQWQVMSELSVIKVDRDLSLDVVSIVACGVPTGWGSATNAALVGADDVIIVMGCGGVGINAVQGAAHRGASHVIAVDPQPLKRDTALKVGATEAFDDIEEATAFARSITNGQGADAAIVAVGVMKSEYLGQAFAAIRKAGTVVVTGIGHYEQAGVPVNLTELSMYQKRIQGVVYGNGSPRVVVPQLLNLYRAGSLKLDELITNRYKLGDINEGYADMHAGKNMRGIIDFRL